MTSFSFSNEVKEYTNNSAISYKSDYGLFPETEIIRLWPGHKILQSARVTISPMCRMSNVTFLYWSSANDILQCIALQELHKFRI